MMLRFSRYLPIASLLLATACSGGVAPIDSREYLDSLDGPEVQTVTQTMLQSATQAELNGNFRMAAQIYEQILEKDPHNLDVMQSLGDSLRRDGQSQRAVAVYDAVIFKQEESPAAKEGKGLALIALGDYDTPIKLFEDVMEKDPTRWKTLNALGILFTTRNMQPEAQQYFNEALKHHPGNPSIMNNLGLSQALELNFDGAIETLVQASGMALPDSSERKRIDLNTALVHASAGNLDQAEMIAQQYLDGAALNNNLGLYAHLAKDDQLARAFLNKALNDSKIHYSKAWENLEEISHLSPAEGSAKKKKAQEPEKAKPAAKKREEKEQKIAQAEPVDPVAPVSPKNTDMKEPVSPKEVPLADPVSPKTVPPSEFDAPKPIPDVPDMEPKEVPDVPSFTPKDVPEMPTINPPSLPKLPSVPDLSSNTTPTPAPAFGQSAQAGQPAITLPGALAPSAGR